ncbi:MAG TPA: hypothetical protein PK629_04330 [Oscillospiraceae bacterium]|nr:hypothetical protein [Oscillospiraceae bacterium]HPK35155.1 hypothetical protein [Oscillospiraceae bacterium]HPR74958.1 hypothetical protein [Oscillospiraceae bacterium]
MFQYLLIPIVVGLVWLIMQIKPIKTLSVKKKRFFSIIIMLVLWTSFGAIPYMFSYNTPEAAIKYTTENWKPVSVVGILDNGTEGAYVIIETHSSRTSYYLKKAGDKWKMPSRTQKTDFQISIYKKGFIHYRHYINEGIVIIEYDAYIDDSFSQYQVTDNKGTVFHSTALNAYVPDMVNIFYYGMYVYDDTPYELNVNGELAFSYSESQ